MLLHNVGEFMNAAGEDGSHKKFEIRTTKSETDYNDRNSDFPRT